MSRPAGPPWTSRTADAVAEARSMGEERGERVDLGRWARRVLTWDTAMPVVVGVVPMGVEWLLPGRRGPVEILAITLPIAAFFCRLIAGRKHIASNACAPWVRKTQFGVLCLGIFPMVIIECFLTLMSVMPKDQAAVVREDVGIFGTLIVAYLACMVVAMYPGKTAPARPWGGDEWIGTSWAEES